MLGRLGIWRHFFVALAIGACSVAAFLGFLGGRGERFDAKQITVSPVGEGNEGVRIREVVDEDFGSFSRHGYERIIPTDFGRPTEVSASSPDADATVGTTDQVSDFRIRLGDPDKTYTGQHRYILSYTLPEAQLSTGVLHLDIIDADEEFETKRFEVIVTGFVFTSTGCDVGHIRAQGGCTLEQTGPSEYRVVFEPLAAGDGVTIFGQIAGYAAPAEPPLPDLPARAADHRVALGLGMIPVGLAGAGVVYAICRRRGRNEVWSGGAVEAAYGRLPTPAQMQLAGAAAPGTAIPGSTQLVADSRLDDLATIEFVPPKGLDPWQGAVLLRERIDDDTVAAWFSALVASEAITIDDSGKRPVLGIGRRRSELDASTSGLVNQFMHGRAQLELGHYDPYFATAWSSIKNRQESVIKASGWWRRNPPGSGGGVRALLTVIIFGLVFVGFSVGATVLTTVLGFAHNVPVALAVGLIVPTVVATFVYATMLRSRSATGSALTLLTESFRRFLDASEGRHVDWAWQQGLLREYSAWAVALGAADAWGRALAASNVPPPAIGLSNPLVVHSIGRSFSSSHTKPSSSGGGGGGGGGGGVGGGGGGGSSGSW